MIHKTKTSFKKRIIFGISGGIAASVLLLSVHAKDLVSYSITSQSLDKVEKVQLKDVSEKASSDLHNHVSKQIVKTFDTSSGDSIIASSRGRDDLDMIGEDDPGLWGRVHETLLMWRALATLPFTI